MLNMTQGRIERGLQILLDPEPSEAVARLATRRHRGRGGPGSALAWTMRKALDKGLKCLGPQVQTREISIQRRTSRAPLRLSCSHPERAKENAR